MFRLHRHKSEKEKLGERIEFKFSHFQASKVPKGWDKLFISIISVETGKTIAKSSKALIHSGRCQWTETLSEFIRVSQDDASKELEDCLFKLIVSMGSARSGILGEAILNITDYLYSSDPDPVSLPLKKCNNGTILQLKIQCLTPKTKFRDGKQWKETADPLENLHADNDDIDNKSDESDNRFNRSIGSSSSNHLGGSSYQDEPGNRDVCFSASGSHRSSDSGESYLGRTNLSPRNSLNGGAYNISGRQDSDCSQNGATYGVFPGEDHYRSNYLSFDSKVTVSGIPPKQWQDISRQKPSPVHALRPSDSSKDFLESAQETIEELRGEARLWERNSQKLKLDLEALKKEFNDQSKHQTDMDMELSAAYTERDSLKLEVEELKLSLEELMVKQMITDTSKIQTEDITHRQKELEDELKFQKESNANLSLQLTKTQESNIELVSILQELEETVEKQRFKMANISQQSPESENKRGLGNNNLLEIKTEVVCDLSVKEEGSIKLEENPPDLPRLQCPNETQLYSRDDPGLIKEIEALKFKVQELERDCAELTEENLDLLFKMKESEKGTIKGAASLDSSPAAFIDNMFSSNSESEIFQLKSQKHQLEQEPQKKEIQSEEEVTETMITQFKELEKKCTNLELDLKKITDKACDLDVRLCRSQMELEEKTLQLTELQQKLKVYREGDSKNSNVVPDRKVEKFESWSSFELPTLVSEIYEQLRLALILVKAPLNVNESQLNTEAGSGLDLVIPNSTDSVSQNEQAEAIINGFIELNDILQKKVVACKAMLQNKNLEDVSQRDTNSTEAQKQLKDYILKTHEVEILNMELQSRNEDISKELLANRSEMEELNANLSVKEEEIEILRHSKSKLENMLAKVQNEKVQLEENLEFALRESSITSKSLDEVRHDFLVLTSSMDSHVSAYRLLQRKSMELENGKQALEFHISELEQENVQLSERISGLEAQLRYLTNEKESSRLELENSKCLVMDLKYEIEKLGAELETQKGECTQKLQEKQNRLSEALEESEFLRRFHSKLQDTVERLIEESSSLQKLTGDLRRQKLELHERCTLLEVELNESHKKSSDFCKKVDILEVKLTSLQKDTSLKERSLISQLEAFFQEHKEHEEKLSQAQILLNQMDQEKESEVENLQREVAHLTAQISSTHDEREKIASDAIREVSSLRADKNKLENSLQEAHAKVKSYEIELYTIRQESGNTIQSLVGSLNASKQSEEMLMEDVEHMQGLMENLKSSKEKVKRTANELELKLKASEYEREQLMEEFSSLKVQLLKITHLQDEILGLKSFLGETIYEKGKLEESLCLISEECEELKAERTSFLVKISDMQKALSDGEDAKRSRVALEEKLLRLEGDLTATEALYAHDAEMKNELNQFKRSNSQYRIKIKCLEDEKDELTRRVQVLEKELNVKKEQNLDEKQILCEGDNKIKDHMPRPQVAKGAALESKVCSLETQLAEASEANNMYKVQLQSFLSKRQNTQNDVHGISATGDEVRIESNEGKSSSLEAELKDMRERYFLMSLRFAEVEAQREELIVKLKSKKNEKSWFS